MIDDSALANLVALQVFERRDAEGKEGITMPRGIVIH
jgi:hypothetical protein